MTAELDERRRAAAVNTDVEFMQALGAKRLAGAAVAPRRRRCRTRRCIRQDPRDRAARARSTHPHPDHDGPGLAGHPDLGRPGSVGRAQARGGQRRRPVRTRLHRAGRRIGHRRGQDPGRPRRRRVGHQRAEDLHLQRPVRHARLPHHPDRPDAAQAQGPDHVPGARPARPGSSGSRCPPSATRRPTSATTATSGCPTGTASARSTTAGRCCTARWTPSTTSAGRPASSKTSARPPSTRHNLSKADRRRPELGQGCPGRRRADDRRQGLPGRHRAPAH